MDIRIDLRGDYLRVIKNLGALADKQIPFATAQALNEIGNTVKFGERKEIKKEFPTAKPFTINAVNQRKARKDNLETIVFVKDIAAAYLAPYLDGGRHHLNSRALLNPKNIRLDQYGNIPKGKLASLKNNPDIFIGSITFKKTGKTVSGVWQRPKTPKRGKSGKRLPGKRGSTLGVANSGPRPTLKLLIRFGDALPVRQHLDWEEYAHRLIPTLWDRAFGRAMAKALATANR